jgi:hypothetical protein
MYPLEMLRKTLEKVCSQCDKSFNVKKDLKFIMEEYIDLKNGK